MRALTIVDGELRVEDRPDPEAAGEQVVVEVHGAGINRADLLQRMGAYPAPHGWPSDVPGLEFAGEVRAAGPTVDGLRAGDRVMGIAGGGAQATHLLVPAALCALVPPALDLVTAGGIPEAFVTAHDALFTQAGLHSGERVLIHGVASGVGTAALQLAKVAGATTIGTSRTPDKLDRCVALGLDRPVLADDDMEKQIGEVDVVIDLIGGPYVELDVRVCGLRGRIVVVGLIAGGSAPLDLGLMMRKRLRLQGTTLRGRPNHEKAAAVAAFAREVVPLLEREEILPVVDRVVSLDDAASGYGALQKNETFGKVVIASREPSTYP